MNVDQIKSWLPERWRSSGPVIPVVRMTGAIGMSTPLRPGMSLASVAGPLKKAFSFKKAPAVAILINSPGGSPVQSRQIHDRIRALAEEKEKEVIVFIEDVAASGGYMIAVAGDEIYADPSSIVGSIGVVAAGFGFEKAIEKLGVSRRVYTSGQRKVILDAFQPENKKDIAHVKALQKEMHETFIDLVKERRGAALGDDEELYSGLFWTGLRAHDFGLIDGIGDMRATLKEKYGEDARPKLVSADRGFFMHRPGGVSLDLGSISASLPGDLISAIEERAMWSRYGL